MANHAILDRETHRDLRVRTEAGAELGDATMACLTVPLEFRRIQNAFPILFRRNQETGKFSALALLGFEDGENLFLEDGRWDADYRPMALAIQPFLLGRPAAGDEPGQVHVDLGHPRIAAPGEGIGVFDEFGNPTPHLEQVAAMLGDLDEGYRASLDFFDALERHDLIEPLAVDVELKDGSQHRLVGYHIVNEDRLVELDGAALGELHKADHLMPIFMALASLSNLAKLARRKDRRLQDG
jgi:hypothetical protein